MTNSRGKLPSSITEWSLQPLQWVWSRFLRSSPRPLRAWPCSWPSSSLLPSHPAFPTRSAFPQAPGRDVAAPDSPPLSPACFALIAASLSGPVAVGTQRLLQPHLGATSLSAIREREAEILCPKSAWRQFARISSLLGCVEGPGDLLAPHQSPSQAGSPQGCHLRSKIRRRAWMWHMDVKHQETFAWCVIFKIRAV